MEIEKTYSEHIDELYRAIGELRAEADGLRDELEIVYNQLLKQIKENIRLRMELKDMDENEEYLVAELQKYWDSQSEEE